jgi:lipopolysaccharide heptosyltransferase II
MKIFSRKEKIIKPERILLIRIDRMGDVILSTPMIETLRKTYPSSFIAMMVKPIWRELLEGNPYLDETISYDKDGAHHGILGTLKFARQLRKYRFDTVLILNPRVRSHWCAWLAGIPVRIGFDSENGWLLTHRVPFRKHEGKKHEIEYMMELFKFFDFEKKVYRPFVTVSNESAKSVDPLFKDSGVGENKPAIAIHPSSSCLSRRWMPERFAELADRLIEKQGVKVFLISGASEKSFTDSVEKIMRHPSINLGGKLSLKETAGLLKRCTLLISNDSGPTHLAAAVGTPVVAIFGASQPGLSATRWRPFGPDHVVLQKDVGCKVCLAHDCDIQFRCLTELSVDEVYQTVVSCRFLHVD